MSLFSRLSKVKHLGKLLPRQLIEASRAGNYSAVKALVEKIEATAPSNKDVLLQLMKENTSGDELLEAISAKGLSHGQTADSLSPGLFEAAAEGHYSIVRLLADHGATLNRAHPEDGSTALAIAAFNEHDEIVQFLVWRGANVNARNNDGVTPFMLAVAKCSLETVTKMIAAGADLHAESADGVTVLDFASMPPRRDILELLSSSPESGVSTVGREIGLNAPAAKGGIRVATYEVGEYVMKIFTDVKSLGPIQYLYILEVSKQETAAPILYITAERSELTPSSPLFMGVFDSTGHTNLGPGEEIGELHMFIARARLEAARRIIDG